MLAEVGPLMLNMIIPETESDATVQSMKVLPESILTTENEFEKFSAWNRSAQHASMHCLQ